MMETYLRFRDAFEQAMDPRLYPIGYLDSLVHSGRAAFWSNDKAAIVAELKAYPSGALVVEGVVAAGEMDGIKVLIPLAENWGRRHGAAMSMISSRPGWAKVLRSAGYAPHQLSIVKDL